MNVSEAYQRGFQDALRALGWVQEYAPTLVAGPVTVNQQSRYVYVGGGAPLDIPAAQYRLMELLMRHGAASGDGLRLRPTDATTLHHLRKVLVAAGLPWDFIQRAGHCGNRINPAFPVSTLETRP